jgi:DNA-binding GntR family transcriptional regulator
MAAELHAKQGAKQAAAGPLAVRGRLTDEAAALLRTLIIEGELPPGSRIGEQALCERLGISRTPLREALKILASEGLVLLSPNRGAAVARLTIEEIEEIMELLQALESLAARLACERATADEIAAIEGLHGEMRERYEARDIMGYFRLNQAIHHALAEASGNRALAQAYRTQSRRIERYRFAGNTRPERWQRAIQEHEQILVALEERDAPLLEALLRSHLVAGWRVAKELLREELEPPEGEGRPERQGRHR